MRTAKKQEKWTWIDIIKMVFVGVIFVGAAIYLFSRPPTSRVNKSIYNAFSSICASDPADPTGVDAAALFAGGTSGPVPTLLLNSQGGPYGSNKGFGEGWNPESVSDVQLVVCIGEERSLSKDCTYTVKLIGLKGRYASVREAKTGLQVGGFKIFAGYSCPGKDVHHEEYSPEAIKAIFERELSAGHIYLPQARQFDGSDIVQDPGGKYTHIRIPFHRLEDGRQLQLTIIMCTQNKIKSIAGIKDRQIYYARWVDENTLQLAAQPGGEPVEISNMHPECRGLLDTNVPAGL